jgi:hypothetical protein
MYQTALRSEEKRAFYRSTRLSEGNQIVHMSYLLDDKHPLHFVHLDSPSGLPKTQNIYKGGSEIEAMKSILYYLQCEPLGYDKGGYTNETTRQSSV